MKLHENKITFRYTNEMLFFEGSCQDSFHYFHHIQILCTWTMVKTPRSHTILSLSFDAASAISPICDHPELGQ